MALSDNGKLLARVGASEHILEGLIAIISKSNPDLDLAINLMKYTQEKREDTNITLANTSDTAEFKSEMEKASTMTIIKGSNPSKF